MDIEQTKKMNFMIRELTRTGAVRSFDDAMAMAGDVYEEGLPESRKSLVVAEESDRVRELVDKRIRQHLSELGEKRNIELKKHAEFCDQMNAEIKRLWAAIEETKQQASKPQHKPVEIESTKEVKESPVQQQAPEPKVVEQRFEPREVDKKPSAPVSHPRAGNYNSEDVALDKFFYFGTGGKK